VLLGERPHLALGELQCLLKETSVDLGFELNHGLVPLETYSVRQIKR